MTLANPASEADPIVQTFTFEPPLVREIDRDGSSYTSVGMPEALTMARQSGDPALPVRFVQILLPPGHTVREVRVEGTLQAFGTDRIDLKQRPVFPHQDPVPFGTAGPAKLKINKERYASNELFPAAHHTATQTGFCRGYGIFSMALQPVKYIPGRGELHYFTELTVTLDLEDTGVVNPFLRAGNQEDAEWVSALIKNPEAICAYLDSRGLTTAYPGGLCDPADDYDYVIITTTRSGLDYWPTSGATPYNWESLMNKHELDDGLQCTLVTVEDIMAEAAYENALPLFNDTAARIREFCKDAYQDWGTDYILIGADDEWIAAREMDSDAEADVDSDIYWNHLDSTFNEDSDSDWGEEGDSGFDLYAELFIGRVTCDTPQDVSNWLKKCFYYTDSVDRDYLDNAAFYGGDTGWNCQGDDFEDYSAIMGLAEWLGPNPGLDPYPGWLGFQYGFETWNSENLGAAYDMSIKWTAEPPNPGGWQGGSTSAAVSGLRNDISNDRVTLLSGIAHANADMSLEVSSSSWEALYHNTRPFFLHDYGCHCGDMDDMDDGVLHSMLFHSDTELAFAVVYNTGNGWGNLDNTCSSSSVQQKSFWDYLFDTASHSGSCDNWQMGKAQAFTKDLMAPTVSYSDSTWRSIVQCCLLFGDPAMKIRPPEEPLLYFAFPEGMPEQALPPGPETVVVLEIQDAKENLVAGSGRLHYRFDPLSAFTEAALTDLGGDRFEATLPNTQPGDQPEFYFSAESSGGATVYSPYNAPTQTYDFDVYMVEMVFDDNFESDQGWTVVNVALEDGPWERGVPAGAGDRGDPLTDSDGSGSCFLTDNVAGNSDVDGGPTQLISPTIDLSSGDAQVGYFRWHYCDDGDDTFLVDLSNNNGSSWTRVETVMPTGAWNYHSFNVASKITPTAQMKFKFSSSDNPNDSVTESGLDGFVVRRVVYDPTLWADAYAFSAAEGIQLGLSLDAGAANAGRQYLVLGSLTGSEPGIALPGGAVLPLNWDNFTDWVLGHLGTGSCLNFFAYLDGEGQATTTLNTGGPIGPNFVGKTISFAYLLEALPDYDFTSNAIHVVIEP